MKFCMKLHPSPFAAIRDGKKDLELRLNDEKRNRIQKGDMIEFTNVKNGETIKAAVIEKYDFNDFEELYASFDKLRLGYTENETANPIDMEKYYSKDDIEKYGVTAIEIAPVDKINAAFLVDRGICPTCFDRKHGNCLYGSKEDSIIYEDENLECFFVKNPRAPGHVAISSKAHYKDMTETPDDLCEYIFVFAKKMMNAIKAVFDCQSVYLCTMCDGPMNHFHVQLIPRYSHEARGSKNFVKPRGEYVPSGEKAIAIRMYLSNH